MLRATAFFSLHFPACLYRDCGCCHPATSGRCISLVSSNPTGGRSEAGKRTVPFPPILHLEGTGFGLGVSFLIAFGHHGVLPCRTRSVPPGQPYIRGEPALDPRAHRGLNGILWPVLRRRFCVPSPRSHHSVHGRHHADPAKLLGVIAIVRFDPPVVCPAVAGQEPVVRSGSLPSVMFRKFFWFFGFIPCMVVLFISPAALRRERDLRDPQPRSRRPITSCTSW